jgi:hypothetical protein
MSSLDGASVLDIGKKPPPDLTLPVVVPGESKKSLLSGIPQEGTDYNGMLFSL